jgi:nickel-type superoxide dismutase maturation protease
MEPPPSTDERLAPDERSPETYHHARKQFAGAGALVALGLAWACLRWRPSRVQIEGGSMAPTLVPGDWALVATPHRFAAGDVVVVEHPQRPAFEMVKRLIAVPGDLVADRKLGEDEFWVEGDLAPASTDSRQFGPVGRASLKAKVLLVYWPKDRRRLVS